MNCCPKCGNLVDEYDVDTNGVIKCSGCGYIAYEEYFNNVNLVNTKRSECEYNYIMEDYN